MVRYHIWPYLSWLDNSYGSFARRCRSVTSLGLTKILLRDFSDLSWCMFFSMTTVHWRIGSQFFFFFWHGWNQIVDDESNIFVDCMSQEDGKVWKWRPNSRDGKLENTLRLGSKDRGDGSTERSFRAIASQAPVRLDLHSRASGSSPVPAWSPL